MSTQNTTSSCPPPPRPLQEYLEDRVQLFSSRLRRPGQGLPVDRGEYVWIVQGWGTNHAVDEPFPEARRAAGQRHPGATGGERPRATYGLPQQRGLVVGALRGSGSISE